MLHSLEKIGNFASLLDLLNNETNRNNRMDHGNAPHYIASFSAQNAQEGWEDSFHIARVLIHLGANVGQMNDFCNTLLHFATSLQNDEMVDILLQVIAQIKLRNNRNAGLQYAINSCALSKRYTPYICPGGHSRADWITVKRFSQCHPDSYRTDNLKEISLLWAIKVGDIRIFHELLQKSFFPNPFDVRLSKALPFAVDQPKEDFNIVDELKRHGVYPGISNASSQNPLDSYFSRHQMDPRNERNIVSFILKLFLLKGNILSERQIALIRGYRKGDIYKCLMEISLMERDKITPGMSVYDMVSQHIGTSTQLSTEEYDELLAKLLTGNYPIYSDFIAFFFPRFYLSSKFAEICWWAERNSRRIEFLNYDMRFWLSYYYLSPFDMYIMMFLGK